jgi:hypothetical protein
MAGQDQNPPAALQKDRETLRQGSSKMAVPVGLLP